MRRWDGDPMTTLPISPESRAERMSIAWIRGFLGGYFGEGEAELLLSRILSLRHKDTP